jgi:hypothetical protein
MRQSAAQNTDYPMPLRINFVGNGLARQRTDGGGEKNQDLSPCPQE